MNTDCRRAYRLIHEALSAAPVHADVQWLEEHVHQCTACAQVRRELQAMAHALRVAGAVPMPEDSVARVRQRLTAEQGTARRPWAALRLAVAILVCGAAAGVWLWPERDAPSSHEVAAFGVPEEPGVPRAQPREAARHEPPVARAPEMPQQPTRRATRAPRAAHRVVAPRPPAVASATVPSPPPAAGPIRIYERIVLAAQTGGLSLGQYRSGLATEPEPVPELAAARAAAAVGETARAAEAYEEALAEPPLELVMRARDATDDVRIMAALREGAYR